MTLYNKGPYVAEAMRSVLEGSFADLELLVVDDASTDEGSEVVRSFNDARVRFLPAEWNQGRAAAANRGYYAAAGEYIAVLDADDVAHPERFAKQVAFMDANPNIGVSGTAATSFGAEDRTYHWPATDRECRALLLFTDPVLYGSCIMRRELIVANNMRSREDWLLPAEDYLFMLRMSRITRFANLQEPMLRYRIGEQNQRHGRNAADDRKAVLREAFRTLGVPASEVELDLQLLSYKLTRSRITAQRVADYFQWTEQLMTMNRAHGWFDAELFEREVRRRRESLFYLLPEHGIAAARKHMELSGTGNRAKWVYLMKVVVKRGVTKG